MANCEFNAPNGKPSLLFGALSQKVGEAHATQLWYKTYSEEFLSKFGDWQSTESEVAALDENGEPAVEEVLRLIGPQSVVAFQGMSASEDDRSINYYTLDPIEARSYGENVRVVHLNTDDYLNVRTHRREYNDMLKGFREQSGKNFDLLDNSAEGLATQQEFFNFLKEHNYKGLNYTGYEDSRYLVGFARSLTEQEPLQVDPKKIFEVADLAKQVEELYAQARANPEKQYSINIDTQSKDLVFGRVKIPLIKAAEIFSGVQSPPSNITFNTDFALLFKNLPSHFLNLIEDRPIEEIVYDQARMQEQLQESFVPLRDLGGQPTGDYFSVEKQLDTVKAMIQAFNHIYTGNETQSVAWFKQTIKHNIFQVWHRIYTEIADGAESSKIPVTAEQAKTIAANYQKVLNSYEDFWNKTMEELADIGVVPKRNRREEHVEEDLSEDAPKGLKDWNDSSFEFDRKDSASKRMKMYFMTIPEAAIGREETPPTTTLIIGNPETRVKIEAGIKNRTARKHSTDPNKKSAAQAIGIPIGGEGLVVINNKQFRLRADGPATAADIDRYGEEFKEDENMELQVGDMMYTLTPYVPKEQILVREKNWLNLPVMAEYEDVYRKVMSLLSDSEPDFDTYMQLLEDSRIPNMLSVAQTMRKASAQMKNEFVSLMSNQYQRFTMVMTVSRKGKDGLPYTRYMTFDSNRQSQLGAMVQTWQQNQKFNPILQKDASGTTVINRELARELNKELLGLQELLEKNAAWTTEQSEQAQALFKKVLEVNGIPIEPETIEYFVKYADKLTKNTRFSGKFMRQFSRTIDGKPSGIVSAMIMGLINGPSEDSAADTEQEEEDKTYALNNPLYQEKTAVRALAKLMARQVGVLYSDTHRSAEGKTIYDHGFHSSLSHAFREIRTSQAYREELSHTAMGKHSWLLQTLNNNPDLREKMSLTYFDALKHQDRNRDSGITRAKMSDREQLIAALGMFANNGRAGEAHYFSLTHSDKTTSPLFRNAPRIAKVTEINENNNLIYPLEVMEAMFKVFQSEYERIKTAEDGDVNHDKFNGGAKFFFFLPFLNYQAMKEMVAKEQLTEAELATVWLSEGKINDKQAKGFKPVITKLMTRHLNTLVRNTLQKWEQEQITSKYLEKAYTHRLLTGAGYKYDRVSKLYQFGERTFSTAELEPHIMKLVARDFEVNSLLFNIGLAQTLYGDPAEAWKGSIELTMTEYGKRLAKDIAPGSDGAWEKNETYTTVTLADYQMNVKEVAKIIDAYKSVEATDAQEFTTVEEHLRVMKSQGELDEKTFAEMLKVIKDANGEYYEFTDPKHIAIVFQPHKPVYSKRNKDGFSEYVKSSSFPLYPPMVEGWEIDKLRSAMEKDGVARVNFASAKKLGSPSTALILFTKDGRINEETFQGNGWKEGARQALSRSGFRIQQKVPSEPNKDKIGVVSQMNKLLTLMIDPQEDYVVDGKKVKGAQIKELKEDVRKQMLQQAYLDTMKEIGAEKVGGLFRITSGKKLWERLEQETDLKKGYSDNDLAVLRNQLEDGRLMIPLMFSPSSAKFESLVMSVINAMVKLKVDGKSYIQASPAGMRWTSSMPSKSRIVWIPGYDGGELLPARPGPDGTILPGQVLIPFNFVVGGKVLKAEDFMETREDGKRVLDLARVPRELLHLVAARIPNQGPNSMHPVEVVGFLPPSMGDMMIVPAAFTKQMGADFDVDKIFAYRRPFKYNAETQSFELVSTVVEQVTRTLSPTTKRKKPVVDRSLSWNEIKNIPVDVNSEKINVMRKEGESEHFGNPFSPNPKLTHLVQVPSIPDAVGAYLAWLDGQQSFTTSDGVTHDLQLEQGRRDWIVKQIRSGKLDGKTFLYMREKGDYYSHAHALADLVESTPKANTVDPGTFHNHSGGAEGADLQWDQIGQSMGFTHHHHYWMTNKTPHGNEEISKADAEEGQKKVTIAARQMGRIAPNQQVRQELLIRNWVQVKNADAVFAVTTMLKPGDEMNYGKRAAIPQGKGGTGYAIQMAINEGKPVYVFDQEKDEWFKYTNGKWEKSGVPTLTPNFAGIGTREINAKGKAAIKAVYDKVLNPEEEIITEDTPLNKAQLKAAYFNLHWDVLTSPKMYQAMMSPLEKKDLKEEAKVGQKAVKVENYFSAGYQLAEFQGQKEAKQLVGSSSLTSTFNAQIQDKDLKIGWWELQEVEEGKFEAVPEYLEISVVDHTGMTLKLASLSGYGTTDYDGERRTKSDNITSLQNEFLDYAKNKVVDKLNINEVTYPAAAAMCMLQTESGQALNLAFITRLLRQPAVKDFVERIKRSSDSFEMQYQPDLRQTIFNDMVWAMEQAGAKEPEGKISTKDLTKEMENPTSGFQLAALKLFRQFDTVGNHLTKVQATYNQDTKGSGPDLLTTLQKQENHDSFNLPFRKEPSDIFVMNTASLLRWNGKSTEMGQLFTQQVGKVTDLLRNVLPYEGLKPIFEKLGNQMGRPQLSVEMKKNIARDYKAYVLTSVPLNEPLVQMRKRLLYGPKSLANRLYAAKDTWGADNYLLKRMLPVPGMDGLSPDHVRYEASKINLQDDRQNSKAWIELLNHDHPDAVELGIDLIKYMYMTGGVQDAANIVKYIPYSFLMGTKIPAYLRGVFDLINQGEGSVVLGLQFQSNSFIAQYFQHNPQHAPNLSADMKELGVSYTQIPKTFELPRYNGEDAKAPQNRVYIMDTDPGERRKTKKAPNFLSVRDVPNNRWILFARTGDQSYTQIDLLGDQYMYEFSQELNINKSFVPENKAAVFATFTEAPVSRNPGIAAVEGPIQGIGFSEPRGGEAEIKASLQKIAADGEQPAHLRTLAGALAEMPMMSVESAFHNALYKPQFIAGAKELSISFEVLPDSTAARGYYQAQTNHITLGQHQSKKGLAETFLHELQHMHTVRSAFYSESEKYLKSKGYKAKEIAQFLVLREQAYEQFPELYALYDQLGRVREEARKALMLDMRKKGVKHSDVVAALSRGETGPWSTLVYAMESNSEFIAHCLTNPEVMKFLNTVDTTVEVKASPLQSVLDLIAKIFVSISKALGIPVREGSALEAAARLNLQIINFNNDKPFNVFFGGPSPNIVNKALPFETVEGIDRVLGKLKQQQEELRSSLTSRLDRKQRAEKLYQLDQLREDIDLLSETRDPLILQGIGKRQMKWIKSVVQDDNATISQVTTALRILDLWSELLKLVYGTEKDVVAAVDPGYAEIATEAQALLGPTLDKAERLYQKIHEGTIKMEDFLPENLVDAGFTEVRIRSVSAAAKSKVVQTLATSLETAARNSDTEITDFLTKGAEPLEKRARAAARKRNMKLNEFYELFMQESEDNQVGLVHEYSQKWENDLANAKKTKDGSMEAASQSKTMTEAEKTAARGAAWNKYWNFLQENTIMVDTRKFFDMDSGALKDGPHVEALEKALGKEAAQRAIQDAQKKYQEYLDRKMDVKTRLDGEVATGNKTVADAEKDFQRFISHNSPNEFFANETKHKKFFGYSADKYIIAVPRPSINGYYDEKYREIKKDPELEAFYNDYLGYMRKLISYLPVYVQQDLPKNFVPVVYEQFMMDLKDVPGYAKALGKEGLEALTATKDQVAYRNSLFGKIPIDYVKVKHKGEQEDRRSRDLVGVLEKFAVMAVHYKHMADVKDEFEMGQAILEQVSADPTVKGSLQQAILGLNYMKEFSMFKKARKLEGVSDARIYSLNPRTHFRKDKEYQALRKELKQLMEDYENADLEQMDELMDKIQKTMEKMKPYEEAPVFIGSKFGDQLIKISQLKALSYNPFSGLANLGFALVSTYVYAAGKQEMDLATTAMAFKMMMHSTARSVSFDSIDTKTAQKILAVMDRLGVIGDIVDSQYGQGTLRRHKPLWKKVLDPFAMLRSGDYFGKGLSTVSLLLHEKVKVTEDGVEKEIPIWQALDEDGKWNEEKYGKNPEWYNEEGINEKEWEKLRNKVIRVNTIIHGNQDRNSAKMFNKWIWGRLIGQFRLSWLPEGWYSRFGEERDDVQLGRATKGRYRTIGELGIGGYLYVTLRQLMSLVSKSDPFQDIENPKTGEPLSDTDKANMRKNFAELSFYAGVMAAILMLKASMDDDDDEKKKAALQLLINMLIRMKQDLAFYSSPDVFDTVTRNVIPASDVLKDYLKAVKATGRVLVDDEYEFAQWFNAMTRAGLPIPQATLINKYNYMSTRDLDDLAK